jgi:hypothetical protein
MSIEAIHKKCSMSPAKGLYTNYLLHLIKSGKKSNPEVFDVFSTPSRNLMLLQNQLYHLKITEATALTASFKMLKMLPLKIMTLQYTEVQSFERQFTVNSQLSTFSSRLLSLFGSFSEAMTESADSGLR